MCRVCLERLLRESSVTLHTCKEEGCVHPVQVKSSNDRFPSQPKSIITVRFRTEIDIFPFLVTSISSPVTYL